MLGGEIEIERGNSRKHNLKHSLKEKKSGRSFLITNLIHNFLALQMSTNFFYPISKSLMNFLTILLQSTFVNCLVCASSEMGKKIWHEFELRTSIIKTTYVRCRFSIEQQCNHYVSKYLGGHFRFLKWVIPASFCLFSFF